MHAAEWQWRRPNCMLACSEKAPPPRPLQWIVYVRRVSFGTFNPAAHRYGRKVIPEGLLWTIAYMRTCRPQALLAAVLTTCSEKNTTTMSSAHATLRNYTQLLLARVSKNWPPDHCMSRCHLQAEHALHFSTGAHGRKEDRPRDASSPSRLMLGVDAHSLADLKLCLPPC